MYDFSFSQLTNPPVPQSPIFHTSIQQRQALCLNAGGKRIVLVIRDTPNSQL